LDNLAKSYQVNLLKIGANLGALGEKIRFLESNNPAGNLNPFMNLCSTLNSGQSNGGSFVTTSDFNKAKGEIEDAFLEVKEALRGQGGSADAPASLTGKGRKGSGSTERN
jgi:hypothetical protein